MAKQVTLSKEEIWYYDYTLPEGEDIVPTTVPHEREVNAVKSTLRQQFAGQRAGVYSELGFTQIIEGKLRGGAPDIAVVKGVAFDVHASTWLIPERGVSPQVVIEVGSLSTWRIDVYDKPLIYPLFEVREYFFFTPDPLELGTPFVQHLAPLLGWRWNSFVRTMEQIVPDEWGSHF